MLQNVWDFLVVASLAEERLVEAESTRFYRLVDASATGLCRDTRLRIPQLSAAYLEGLMTGRTLELGVRIQDTFGCHRWSETQVYILYFV